MCDNLCFIQHMYIFTVSKYKGKEDTKNEKIAKSKRKYFYCKKNGKHISINIYAYLFIQKDITEFFSVFFLSISSLVLIFSHFSSKEIKMCNMITFIFFYMRIKAKKSFHLFFIFTQMYTMK